MDKDSFMKKVEELTKKIRILESNPEELNIALKELDKLMSDNAELMADYKISFKVRQILREAYITPTKPRLDRAKSVTYTSWMSPEEKVEYLAQNTRLALSNPRMNWRGEEYDLNEDCLIGECIMSTEHVLEECAKKGIQAEGYNVKNDLGITNTGHAFSIISVDGKKYLVDCTYRQFFTLEGNYDSAKTHNAGAYMLSGEESRRVAEKILRDGWIEATPENVKMYLDGFVMADRKSHEPTGITYAEYAENMAEHPMKLTNKRKRIKRKNNEPKETETRYIVESTPVLYPDMNVETYSEDMPAEKKLRIIVEKERRALAAIEGKDGEKYDLKRDNLRGECISSSEAIWNECSMKNIPAMRFHTSMALGVGKNLGHFFTVVALDGKNYLVDCTYRQFFSETYNRPDCSETIRDPGMYMELDASRRDVAERILRDGWIEATPENMKAYLDGFVMADRRSPEATGITYEEYGEMLATKGIIDKSNITGSDFARLEKKAEISTSEIAEIEETIKNGLIVTREQNSKWIIEC